MSETKTNNKTDNKTETPTTVVNDFEKVEVSNLTTKISSLDFSLKTKSFIIYCL